jgi:hypothetical protein
MTGNEWRNALRTPRWYGRRRSGHMAKGIVGGFIAVILIGVVASLWNWRSDGGLIRALGGVTSQELAAEIAKHPGPPGPAGAQGTPGPPGTVPAVSLIAKTDADHDKSGPIPGSEAYPLCTLSKIVLHRSVKNPDGSCELKRGVQRGDPWEVVVTGAICGVTCFTVGGSK